MGLRRKTICWSGQHCTKIQTRVNASLDSEKNLDGYFLRQVIELFRDSGFSFVPRDSNSSALHGRLLMESKE